MDPFSALASGIACHQLASGVGRGCIHYARGVRHAEEDANLFSSQLQTLRISFQNLETLLENDSAASDHDDNLQLAREIMDHQSTAIEPYCQALNKIQGKLVKAQLDGKYENIYHKLAWPLKKGEIDNAMKTLEEFATVVDRAITVGILRTVTGTDSTTKQILNFNISAEGEQKQRDQDRKEKEERRVAGEIREKILNWLAHPDPSKIHNTVSQSRKSDQTGRWFLDGATFRAFKETPRSLLWLHGDSGSGKSVMCSAIINDLRAFQFQEHRVSLAYWYFSVNEAERSNLQNLLRALLTQFTPNFAASHTLVNLWEANKRGRETAKDLDLLRTLKSMFRNIVVTEGPTSFFIVVDALDESSDADRGKVLDMLRVVLSLEGLDIRLLVTSRSTIDVVQQDWHEAVQIYDVIIPRQSADEDILIHINDRLQSEEELKKWTSTLRNDIKEALMKNAAGMFRWADCQLQAICKCRKPCEVKRALGSLPKDLGESYARELEKVEDDAVKDVRRLLAWLVYSQFPYVFHTASIRFCVWLILNLLQPTSRGSRRDPCCKPSSGASFS